MAEDGRFRVEKFKWQKLQTVEDANGRLSVSEIFVPTIERKDKEADEYEKHRMGYSR